MASHYIHEVAVNPTPSSACPGFFVQGSIYDSSKTPPGKDQGTDLILIGSVYLVNDNGAWHTIWRNHLDFVLCL